MAGLGAADLALYIIDQPADPDPSASPFVPTCRMTCATMQIAERVYQQTEKAHGQVWVAEKRCGTSAQAGRPASQREATNRYRSAGLGPESSP
jgi:hypothetical protein